MELVQKPATKEDIDVIFQLCRQLIEDYERPESIDYPKVLAWVQKKLEDSVGEYTAVYVNGQKAGFYHFFRNEEGLFELDDLYIFPEFQNRGIGTQIIGQCCARVREPVMLYVFIRNSGAVRLYRRLGFQVTQTIHGSRYIMLRNPL